MIIDISPNFVVMEGSRWERPSHIAPGRWMEFWENKTSDPAYQIGYDKGYDEGYDECYRDAKEKFEMKLNAQLQRWHKLLSWCTGGMVLTLAGKSKGRGLSRSEAEQWIKHIETVAKEIKEVIKK